MTERIYRITVEMYRAIDIAGRTLVEENRSVRFQRLVESEIESVLKACATSVVSTGDAVRYSFDLADPNMDADRPARWLRRWTDLPVSQFPRSGVPGNWLAVTIERVNAGAD